MFEAELLFYVAFSYMAAPCGSNAAFAADFRKPKTPKPWAEPALTRGSQARELLVLQHILIFLPFCLTNRALLYLSK